MAEQLQIDISSARRLVQELVQTTCEETTTRRDDIVRRFRELESVTDGCNFGIDSSEPEAIQRNFTLILRIIAFVSSVSTYFAIIRAGRTLTVKEKAAGEVLGSLLKQAELLRKQIQLRIEQQENNKNNKDMHNKNNKDMHNP